MGSLHSLNPIDFVEWVGWDGRTDLSYIACATARTETCPAHVFPRPRPEMKYPVRPAWGNVPWPQSR